MAEVVLSARERQEAARAARRRRDAKAEEHRHSPLPTAPKELAVKATTTPQVIQQLHDGLPTTGTSPPPAEAAEAGSLEGDGGEQPAEDTSSGLRLVPATPGASGGADDGGERLRLLIKTLTGETFDVSIHSKASVAELKAAIEGAEGTSPDSQRLALMTSEGTATRQLGAKAMLSEYGLQDGSRLLLVKRLQPEPGSTEHGDKVADAAESHTERRASVSSVSSTSSKIPVRSSSVAASPLLRPTNPKNPKPEQAAQAEPRATPDDDEPKQARPGQGKERAEAKRKTKKSAAKSFERPTKTSSATVAELKRKKEEDEAAKIAEKKKAEAWKRRRARENARKAAARAAAAAAKESETEAPTPQGPAPERRRRSSASTETPAEESSADGPGGGDEDGYAADRRDESRCRRESSPRRKSPVSQHSKPEALAGVSCPARPILSSMSLGYPGSGPETTDGGVHFATARFGARTAMVSGADAVLCEPDDASRSLRNPSALRGCVAVARRGGCSFVAKARRAQAAGAIALFLVNSDDNLFVVDGEGPDDNEIAIPVVMAGATECRRFLAQLKAAAAEERLWPMCSFTFDLNGPDGGVDEYSSSSESVDDAESVGSSPDAWRRPAGVDWEAHMEGFASGRDPSGALWVDAEGLSEALLCAFGWQASEDEVQELMLAAGTRGRLDAEAYSDIMQDFEADLPTPMIRQPAEGLYSE